MAHYDAGIESHRLARGSGRLEFVRTQELLQRYLPPAPAVILDVGGGPGIYARWLAELGYSVHLLDPVALHVAQANAASVSRPQHPFASVSQGDARQLPFESESAEAVLLLGPLYHLTEREDRLTALREAFRVLRPGGRVFAASISRFASALDGLRKGFFADPEFVEIYERDLLDGQHRNPTNHPGYFTTAYFHHPLELRGELLAAGFQHEDTLAIEGPAWMLPDLDKHWEDAAQRERLLAIARAVEREPSLLGMSAHLLGIGLRAG